MFVINPPWTLAKTLHETLPALAALLAQGTGARHTITSRTS
jgi:23S rRNA (adenine2030-N6)-methyltransferase